MTSQFPPNLLLPIQVLDFLLLLLPPPAPPPPPLRLLVVLLLLLLLLLYTSLLLRRPVRSCWLVAGFHLVGCGVCADPRQEVRGQRRSNRAARRASLSSFAPAPYTSGRPALDACWWA